MGRQHRPTFLAKDGGSDASACSLVCSWNDTMYRTAAEVSDVHTSATSASEFTDCPTLRHFQPPTSTEQHGHQQSGCDTRRTLTACLQGAVSLDVPALCAYITLPLSFFFNSANPVTKPRLTFSALRPVTGWVRTAGWWLSIGGRFGSTPQRSKMESSGCCQSTE